MVERLRALLEWRKHVNTLAKAIKQTLPNCHAYIIGGAAENRLTAKSDIDVLIVCRNPPTSAQEIAEKTAKIREILEKEKIEWSHLYEFHITDEKTAQKYLENKPKIKIT